MKKQENTIPILIIILVSGIVGLLIGVELSSIANDYPSEVSYYLDEYGVTCERKINKENRISFTNCDNGANYENVNVWRTL